MGEIRDLDSAAQGSLPQMLQSDESTIPRRMEKHRNVSGSETSRHLSFLYRLYFPVPNSLTHDRITIQSDVEDHGRILTSGFPFLRLSRAPTLLQISTPPIQFLRQMFRYTTLLYTHLSLIANLLNKCARKCLWQ
jgi:hypothetical protein